MNISLKIEKPLAEIIENSTRWDNGGNDLKDCEPEGFQCIKYYGKL